jgi:hypothetical protein
MALKFSFDVVKEKTLSNNRHLMIIYDRKNNQEVVGRGSPCFETEMNLACP